MQDLPIACKDKNNLPVGVSYRRVIEYTGGAWQFDGLFYSPVDVFAYQLCHACMHYATHVPGCLPGVGNSQA